MLHGDDHGPAELGHERIAYMARCGICVLGRLEKGTTCTYLNG